MATRLDTWVRPILGAGLALALPPRCPGCGTIVDGDHRFCAECWRALDFLGDPACRRCGVPLDIGGAQVCEPCDEHPPTFDTARAAVAYGELARRVVLRLKYGRRPGIAHTLAVLMGRWLAELPEDALIVAVPLHRWRLWNRGYNQSLLIARSLASRSGRRCIPDLLVRTRATPPLGGLGRAARAQTVRDAFAVHPAHRDAFAGRTVILVDDVLTTGATANACAIALKRGGATSVSLLCWARVLPGGDDR